MPRNASPIVYLVAATHISDVGRDLHDDFAHLRHIEYPCFGKAGGHDRVFVYTVAAPLDLGHVCKLLFTREN